MKKETLCLKSLLLISVLCVGGFHIFSSALLTLFLTGIIIFKTFKTNKQKASLNLVLITFAVIVFSYLIVSLWAVDSGTAIYGFIKYLPVLLFAFLTNLYSYDERREVLTAIPWISVITGYVSFVMSFVPQLEKWMLVAERLGGFFQSPNVFAVFTLVGIIVLLSSEKLDWKKWVLLITSVILVFLSGSRTVFVLLLLVLIVSILKLKNRKTKIAIISSFFVIVLLSVVIAVLTDSFQTFGRFLTISLNSSTFLGRFLYFKDAIPVIFKNPFGLGYYGYYFSQGSFQTGVYSTAFIHNSVLQLLLDIGFVPVIFFCATLVSTIVSDKVQFREKFILVTIFLHSLFDFDFQFISILFVLVLTLDFEVFEVKQIKVNKVHSCVTLPLALLSIYFAAINILFLGGKFSTVEKIYGNDTQSKIYLLQSEENEYIAKQYADEIIEDNGMLAIAYDYKANLAFEDGDFEKVIEYKKKAIECAPYNLEEYLDYLDKLFVGIRLYTNVSEYSSAEICIKEAKKVKKQLEKQKTETSSLAWKIQDKPQLDLPQEYEEILNSLSSKEN